MEKEYKCGGICSPSLFYVDLPVTNGPPELDCIAAVTAPDKWDNNYPVGAVAILTAIIMIVASVAGIPLCRGYKTGGSSDVMSKDHA